MASKKHKPMPIEQAHLLTRELCKLTRERWTARGTDEYHNEKRWSAEQGDWYLVNLCNDQVIWMDYDQYKGRYDVRGLIPRAEHEYNPRGTRKSNPGSIGVSSKRDGVSIARDIMRRLIPDYTGYMLACRAAAKEHSAKVSITDDLVNTLQDAGMKLYGQGTDTTASLTYNFAGYPSMKVRFDVYNDQPTFSIEVSLKDVESVLCLLNCIK